jgi:hypothetical protein
VPGAFSAEVMANTGWDAASTPARPDRLADQMVAMQAAVSTTAAVPLVRVS